MIGQKTSSKFSLPAILVILTNDIDLFWVNFVVICEHYLSKLSDVK